MIYTRTGQEILRDGVHFADACNIDAASLILDALCDQSYHDQQLPLPIETELFAPRPHLHSVRQESDEYACKCGARWAVSDGEEHP